VVTIVKPLNVNVLIGFLKLVTLKLIVLPDAIFAGIAPDIVNTSLAKTATKLVWTKFVIAVTEKPVYIIDRTSDETGACEFHLGNVIFILPFARTIFDTLNKTVKVVFAPTTRLAGVRVDELILPAVDVKKIPEDWESISVPAAFCV
jgi:hypothetical protein